MQLFNPIKFASFEKVYTPRARQTLCEQRRPDLTYNDTIKRIQSAKQNTELLKKLAKQQVEKLKRNNNKQGKECTANDVVRKDFPTTSKLNINKSKKKREKQARPRSLGKLESVDHFTKSGGVDVAQPFYTKTQEFYDCKSENIGTGRLKYYFQLATDYYQQGFLQNIKYLENLGERNRQRRERQLQLQLQQQPQQQTLKKVYTLGDFSKINTNIFALKSISLEGKSITDASLNSCDQQQQQINQNNPISCHKRQQQIDNFPLANDKNINCAIRVNIKPQTANTSHQGIEIYGKNTIIRKSKHFSSMNDYLNGNLEYTQLQLQQLQQEHHHLQQPQSFCNHNYSSRVLQLDNLIDNLRELDIQENRTNLPRITLTDYTHKYPNELETDYQAQAATTTAEENKKRLNAYLIKKSSLDCSNLDIPLETHYHSEARPP